MTEKSSQRRAEILAQMNEIESMEAGKLCEMRRERAAGPARVYFNHQYWKDGANHSRYVPAGQVAPLQEAIEGRRRFEQLAQEFVEITVAETRRGCPERSKKNSAKKSVRPDTGRAKRS